MKQLKFFLIALLAITTAAFAYTNIRQNRSGAHEPPEIACPQKELLLSVKDGNEVLLKGVTASDPQDGDLTKQIRISGISKLISNNTAKVTYLVFDSDDNMASCTRTIRYTDYRRPTFAISSPLVFSSTESIVLLERIAASDVIDGDISSSIRISTLESTPDSSVKTVTIQVTNSMGDTSRLSLPIIIEENDPMRPVLTLTSNLIYIAKGSEFNAEGFIAEVSAPEQRLDEDDVEISGEVNTELEGTYYVYYTCTSKGHTARNTLTVVVE